MRKLKNEELNRLSIEDFKKAKKIPLIVVLDNVRSMNNVGSVFRTGDAFLIEGIFLCGITATPPHKDIHKTALGSTESVSWKYYKDTVSAIEDLHKQKYMTIAVEQAEKSIKLKHLDVQKGKKYAVVLGNEVKGVEQKIVDMCKMVVDIDQYGTKHSLNISVCTGIVIWEFFNKLFK